jgi:uncharacterized protein YmfQ (DUF2313 family)
MIGTIFNADQFKSAIKKLLPRGRVWSRDIDTVQDQVYSALAPTYERQTAAAIGLLNDSPPFSLDQMLPEWEAALGLPDPCVTTAQSHSQRVAQVISKLSYSGGQTVAYFVGLAEAVGYPDVSIQQYAPFRVGRSAMGSPLGTSDWAFAWTVNAPSLPVIYFSMGISAMGDGLYSLGGKELQCTINRYAPAHTLVTYANHYATRETADGFPRISADGSERAIA